MNTVQSSVIQIDWVAIAALMVTIIGMLVTAVWVISSRITKSFHTVDKRIHGVEMIVTPYGARMDNLDSTMQQHADRISRIEGMQEARTTIIERHERMLESLTGR